MKERVINSARGLFLEKNSALLDVVITQTNLSYSQILQKQPEVLDRFLSTSSHIVTLDSFFSSILRSSSLELGLEPDFVTKEKSDEELENYFLEELKGNGLLSSLVKLSMSVEDKKFLKIFNLMEQFYQADPLLPDRDYLIYNLSDMENEITAIREDMYNMLLLAGVSKTALNNFMPISIKKFISKTIFEKDTLYDHTNYKKYLDTNPKIEENFLSLKSIIRDYLKAKESIILFNIFNIYDHYKNSIITNAKASGVLTFNDLTYFTYRLLYEGMSKEFLYFKIDTKFKHILLDEFQDTSTLQFFLLKPLIDEIFSGYGQSEFKSFFYVGDTKQSLYRFRGGVEELFDKVAITYNIEIKNMDTNYRSSSNIVNQVNKWFGDVIDGYISQKVKMG